MIKRYAMTIDTTIRPMSPVAVEAPNGEWVLHADVPAFNPDYNAASLALGESLTARKALQEKLDRARLVLGCIASRMLSVIAEIAIPQEEPKQYDTVPDMLDGIGQPKMADEMRDDKLDLGDTTTTVCRDVVDLFEKLDADDEPTRDVPQNVTTSEQVETPGEPALIDDLGMRRQGPDEPDWTNWVDIIAGATGPNGCSAKSLCKAVLWLKGKVAALEQGKHLPNYNAVDHEEVSDGR